MIGNLTSMATGAMGPLGNVINKIFLPLPHVGFHFEVTILANPKKAGSSMGAMAKSIGKTAAGAVIDNAFQEVSGVSSELKFEEIQAGGENDKTYKLPKSVSYPNLVLKRGVAGAYSPLVDWCGECMNSDSSFKIETKMLVLSLLDLNQHTPVATWNFYDAYPVKYEVSGFNAEENNVLIENIEIAYSKYT